MKEYKTTKGIYVLPIIFITLFIIAIILICVLLKDNDISLILSSASIPFVLLVLTTIYIIKEINAPNTSLKASKEALYVCDNKISCKEIKNISIKLDFFFNTKIVLVLKDDSIYYINHIKNASDVVREIKIKYLKIYK